ncbi:uncharacterized protein LOC133190072 [Saccostrea echinata]|uniref:uncharacterized protein LOC133190072 n=1 Tax=Saccostrea echinata TaxID=191078 RepID=UPI002A7FC2A2|nr:uncharacterized protein LOC133190072 [Saccostrea echinata]XP_061181529.1 uncharacterized protein LOC133190072 [Saccostrea echinata]
MKNSEHLSPIASVTVSGVLKNAETIIEDIEEEKKMALFIVVVMIGVIFAVLGAGMTIFWVYRRTNSSSYRWYRQGDQQRLQATLRSSGNVKQSKA